ncbi:MAG: hypothetical protein GX221_08445 [Candidatus Riflebacteria bacterium]|nr:hypothetical protein [Candidatus Riflebacteria bacterium]
MTAALNAMTETSQAMANPTLEELSELYSAQHRECWLCEKIASKISAGKELSEDDTWHFSSCILSWEHLNNI